jgi:hypothetical protein
MKSTGDRASWLTEIADQIMDGGDNPPSIDRLYLVVPHNIVTAANDGYVTAAAAFGEARRDDCRAGQQVIVQEMVQLLRNQGFVGGDDSALVWLKELDGEWQVAVDDHQFTVRGQLQRRLIKDRHSLGERSEESGERIGTPGTLESGNSRPFPVDVMGARGGIKPMAFQVHPLALAIPPMTEKEREALRKDIEANGVKIPLEIFEGKVLDGRNRLYFASILKKPVHIKQFEGTNDQARRHVLSLNVVRRHLNALQRASWAIDLFGDEARKEALASLEKGRILGGETAISWRANSSSSKQIKKWEDRVAEKANDAGIDATAYNVKIMNGANGAPETKAAVERGEIRVGSEVRQRARAEKSKTVAPVPRDHNIDEIMKELAKFIEFLSSVLTWKLSIGETPSERLDQIEQHLIPQVRKLLQERKVIK